MSVRIGKKKIKKAAFVVVGLFLCAFILNKLVFNDNFSIAAVTGTERKLPIYCVDTQEKKVAISFDAAWGDDHTVPIMDILDKYKVKSTFFLVEFWVDKFPDDVKEIQKRGHEIGSHSSTHPDMAKLTQEQIEKELKGPEEKIKALTGTKPTVFRPPFGSYNNTLLETCEANGYHVIQWSIDSLDWKDISADQIVERVTRNIKPGAIILFHNNANYVEEYLPIIIEKLQSDGYKIVPVGELIMKDNYHMDNTGKQLAN